MTIRLLSLLLSVAVSGCSTTPISQSRESKESIRWPVDYGPEKRQFFVHNQIEINAPAQKVWKVLVDWKSWQTLYRGAEDVALADPGHQVLQSDSVFRWKTMGLRFVSTIKEYKPGRLLAWESVNPKIRGYHVWLIVPRGDKCLLITDEAQRGWLTFFEKLFQPNKLHRLHDEWLAGIKKKAESLSL